MPHASDCPFWIGEPCDCFTGLDACDAYKEHRDRQLEDQLVAETLGVLDVLQLVLYTDEKGK